MWLVFKKLKIRWWHTGNILERSVIRMGWVSGSQHSRNHLSTLETFSVIASGAGLLVSSR